MLVSFGPPGDSSKVELLASALASAEIKQPIYKPRIQTPALVEAKARPNLPKSTNQQLGIYQMYIATIFLKFCYVAHIC